jgi:hypothetical protein
MTRMIVHVLVLGALLLATAANAFADGNIPEPTTTGGTYGGQVAASSY